ncbi:ParA family protein [Streptomyces sp. NPDC051132]|uniref:ParA family protein n=1 Tax=unclassified Streptomyces TaxID=2593676 RepID=UPI0034140311
MSSSATANDREKVVSKLPSQLRQALKVRAAQHGVDIQYAVEEGISAWAALPSLPATVDTAGADPFSTWLPRNQWATFRETCAQRGVSLIQGLAQSVQVWLDTHPFPETARPAHTRRIIVCNQKGGVGKTTITGGVGAALAEDAARFYPIGVPQQLTKLLQEGGSIDDEHPQQVEQKPGHGLRVLMVDFDPQCHLTKQLGAELLPIEGDSLTKHVAGEAKGDLKDLVVSIEDDYYQGRLHLLPGCIDGFLLDVRLSTVRAREAALERALGPLEGDYDVIIIDCPPSLGLSMDAAIHYARRRDGEGRGQSGVLIVVQAEDSSADAYDLLTDQIEDLRQDLNLDLEYLGIVVNLYDGRRGYIATSSLEGWVSIGDPRVVGLVPDLKEQREAARAKQPLLSYAPKSQQAISMRAIAREIA